jgi:hypothetical protein
VAGKTDKDIADQNNEITTSDWFAWYTDIQLKM